MKKLIFMLLITYLFAAGCSGQQVINVEGESESWESNIAYEIGEHEQIGKGSFKYTGSDLLDNFTYEINYPPTFSVGGDGSASNISESGTTDFPITINLPDNNIDGLSDEVENISITIVFETVSGDAFEETIEYTLR